MPYSTDEDLTKIRPKIMDYGVENWDAQRTEAELHINRILDHQWYRPMAMDNGVDWRDSPFDPTLLLNSDDQLKSLGCYKTLSLVYLYLMKDSPEEDAFERQHKLFAKLFADELRSIMATGIDYDWDESGAITAQESKRPMIRRLRRC